jgi:DNA repair protein RecO (recombination protein O)
MTKQSEAIVLRTYPLREADLLVTLFTRAEGKIRGVARAAQRSKRRFGGALEPLTCVRAHWEDREKQELARLDACEVLQSPLTDPVDYARAVALAHVAEMVDELLPDREANDAVFRLTLSVLESLRHTASVPGSNAGRARRSIWLPLTYFELWLLRLVGFLPELSECITCGAALNGGRAYYHALADGLMCRAHKRLASSEISPESRALAARMFHASLENLVAENTGSENMGEEPWSSARAGDLRRFLKQTAERHLEKKLTTAGMLEKL